MTPDQLALIIELALYRVGDRWRHHGDPDLNRIGNAIREVGEEVGKMLAERRRVVT